MDKTVRWSRINAVHLTRRRTGQLVLSVSRASDHGRPDRGAGAPHARLRQHRVLDKWFEEVVRSRLRGNCQLVRFADDIVIALEDR